MKLPILGGLIERRILVNYRVDPDVLQRRLPAPFRVQRVAGHGIAGICLIRLAGVRPRGVPAMFGFRSENAAHRVAVELPGPDGPVSGVFVPRRDTSSAINAFVGGRLFPGEHHRARFDVRESDDRLHVAVTSRDGVVRLSVEGRSCDRLPEGSVFRSVGEATDFFARGALGWSSRTESGCFDCLELRSFEFVMTPLAVERVASSFFDDATHFPPGSITFDSALLMRGIRHEWHAHAPLTAADDR